MRCVLNEKVDDAGRAFPQQWYRCVLPGVFVLGACGLFVSRTLSATVPAVLVALFGVALCLLLHGGLIVSAGGIGWYVLRPRWRYRFVPWDAVLDVRRPFGFFEPIRLNVRHGRYEPWVWGEPQPNRVLTLEVWSNGYTGGERVWDTIRAYRSAWGTAPQEVRGSDRPA